MVDVNVHVSSHLKEELVWATDKWLWVISTTMLFKNSYSTKELKGTKEYIPMWSLVTYSNCFEIVSTVAFLVSQTRGIYVF